MMRSIGLLAGLLFAGTALAQDDLGFEEEVITGKVQKPEIVVFVQRQNLEKAFDFRLEETFLRKIVDAIRREPF